MCTSAEALAKAEAAPFVHAPVEGSRVFPQWKARPAFPARDDAAASTASHPNVLTIAIRPSLGTGWHGIKR
jgi:hypothetical protein